MECSSVADTDEIAISVRWIFQQLTMVQTLFQCLAWRPIGGTFALIWIVGFVIITFVDGILAAECTSYVSLAIDWMSIAAQAWTFPAFDNRAAGVAVIFWATVEFVANVEQIVEFVEDAVANVRNEAMSATVVSTACRINSSRSFVLVTEQSSCQALADLLDSWVAHLLLLFDCGGRGASAGDLLFVRWFLVAWRFLVAALLLLLFVGGGFVGGVFVDGSFLLLFLFAIIVIIVTRVVASIVIAVIIIFIIVVVIAVVVAIIVAVIFAVAIIVTVVATVAIIVGIIFCAFYWAYINDKCSRIRQGAWVECRLIGWFLVFFYGSLVSIYNDWLYHCHNIFLHEHGEDNRLKVAPHAKSITRIFAYIHYLVDLDECAWAFSVFQWCIYSCKWLSIDSVELVMSVLRLLAFGFFSQYTRGDVR